MNVVSMVRWALEYLQRGGVGAVCYSDVPGCGTAGDGLCGAVEASRVLEAVLCLPAEHHLALMARVYADDVREGPAVWRDLASFVWHVPERDALRLRIHVADIHACGREAADWMVRKWMRPHDGSWREFGRLYGLDHKTACARFERSFEVLLDAWFILARDAMLVSMDDIFEKVPVVA